MEARSQVNLGEGRPRDAQDKQGGGNEWGGREGVEGWWKGGEGESGLEDRESRENEEEG